MADIRAAVPRAALIDTLRPVPAPTVVLIAAPAGYGKTTLLTQVAAATHRKPFATLTIRARDNDHRRLVTARTALVAIDSSGRPTAFPPAVRNLFQRTSNGHDQA